MKSAVVDDIDRKILGALRTQGRISFRELGVLASLSPNATAERVARLRERGVITGFTAQISPEAMGLALQAFIDLKLLPGASMETFEKALCRIDAVQDAASVTGLFDVRLRVACKDPEHLGQLIEKLRSVAGVQETSSTVICRSLHLTTRSKS
ncbi:MAG TPA: Lrp/AsnC family transcriptional regulator [Dyella sp.]|nr:Lrp/AsnC family transcriptional regulator [Dyella sp.]